MNDDNIKENYKNNLVNVNDNENNSIDNYTDSNYITKIYDNINDLENITQLLDELNLEVKNLQRNGSIRYGNWLIKRIRERVALMQKEKNIQNKDDKFKSKAKKKWINIVILKIPVN